MIFFPQLPIEKPKPPYFISCAITAIVVMIIYWTYDSDIIHPPFPPFYNKKFYVRYFLWQRNLSIVTIDSITPPLPSSNQFVIMLLYTHTSNINTTPNSAFRPNVHNPDLITPPSVVTIEVEILTNLRGATPNTTMMAIFISCFNMFFPEKRNMRMVITNNAMEHMNTLYAHWCLRFGVG